MIDRREFIAGAGASLLAAEAAARPVGRHGVAALSQGVAVPVGYSRSTINGVPVTYNGHPVYDNGSNVI